MSAISIRSEHSANSGELAAIREVNRSAFGGSEEADLVDNLRHGYALVSLVAEIESLIVGHILFSRMWIGAASGRVSAVALAPVAVLPGHQRRGVGARLILHGLELLRERREEIVLVVGHPGYYPRFGFSSERAALLGSPFPRDAFMALELRAGALDGIQGSVVYPPPFGI